MAGPSVRVLPQGTAKFSVSVDENGDAYTDANPLPTSSSGIVSVYKSVAATTAGTEVGDLLGGVQEGYIRQVIARADSGGGTDISVQLRLKAGEDDEEYLVYDNPNAAYPVIDSNVDGPFDTSLAISDGDLTLYLDPQANGTIVVRIDFEINT